MRKRRLRVAARRISTRCGNATPGVRSLGTSRFRPRFRERVIGTERVPKMGYATDSRRTSVSLTLQKSLMVRFFYPPSSDEARFSLPSSQPLCCISASTSSARRISSIFRRFLIVLLGSGGILIVVASRLKSHSGRATTALFAFPGQSPLRRGFCAPAPLFADVLSLRGWSI